jgi:hypothetical protein
MYVPDPHRMAHVIAASSLKYCRENPNNLLHEWHDGRCTAAALISPSLETIGAANEVRFLTGDYRRRHFA